MKITDLKPNSKNPRTISDHKLEKLKKSVREFELMMEARPIVVNSKMEILGGNMRYKALEQLGYAEIPDNWVKVMNFNRKEEREFIVKDNIGYGDWDWDSLDSWDAEELNDWGLDISFNQDEYFKTEDKENIEDAEPRSTDDEYATFEIVMLYDNKLLLLDLLNKIKNKYQIEKQEDALMLVVKNYKL